MHFCRALQALRATELALRSIMPRRRDSSSDDEEEEELEVPGPAERANEVRPAAAVDMIRWFAPPYIWLWRRVQFRAGVVLLRSTTQAVYCLCTLAIAAAQEAASVCSSVLRTLSSEPHAFCLLTWCPRPSTAPSHPCVHRRLQRLTAQRQI